MLKIKNIINEENIETSRLNNDKQNAQKDLKKDAKIYSQ